MSEDIELKIAKLLVAIIVAEAAERGETLTLSNQIIDFIEQSVANGELEPWLFKVALDDGREAPLLMVDIIHAEKTGELTENAKTTFLEMAKAVREDGFTGDGTVIIASENPATQEIYTLTDADLFELERQLSQ